MIVISLTDEEAERVQNDLQFGLDRDEASGSDKRDKQRNTVIDRITVAQLEVRPA